MFRSILNLRQNKTVKLFNKIKIYHAVLHKYSVFIYSINFIFIKHDDKYTLALD